MDTRPEPGDGGPGRRLERPPADRFTTPAGTAPAGTAPGEPAAAGSPGRGLASAAAAAAVGAAALIVLAGVFAVSAGLVVVAAVLGRFVALALRAGSRGTIAGRARVGSAVALSVAAVVVAQLGIWLYARSEGGALGLADYLGQTFGWLVPLQVIVAAATTWWSGR